jgi:Cu-Zn family superoxide dismutase
MLRGLRTSEETDMHRRSRLALAVVLAAALAACESASDHHADHAAAPPAPAQPLATEAIAVVHPTKGNTAHGVVRFSATASGVRIEARLGGLSPNFSHAFHVHEWGDASSDDGSAAGGHYNPEGAPHAGPDTPHRHAGDLGNVLADASGNAVHVLEVDNLTIAGPRNPVIGRSVIVHKGTDDFATQPTGNAGPRIGCGVVGIAQPPEAKSPGTK